MQEHTKEKRRRVWINRLQTELCIRIVLYLALYQIVVVVGLASWYGVFLNGPELLGVAPSAYFALLVFTMVGVAIMFMRNAVLYSHRIVGPLYRFRKAMQAVTAGEELEPIKLRKTDYLQELKDEFNEMLKALEERRAVRFKPAEAQEAEKLDETLPV